jgi:uncharacterized Zn finger protein
MEKIPDADEDPEKAGGGIAGIRAASLFCDHCGETTPHRILRLDPRGRAPQARIRGVARCRVCRFTHPFESLPEARVDLAMIVSEGATSRRGLVSLPGSRKLQVGSGVPEAEEPLTIRRIDDRTGRPRSHALAREAATLWVTRDTGAVVAVSVVEGRRTHSTQLTLPHGTRLAVGDELSLEEGTVEIVGLRARRQTWRRPGDGFSADEVDRVYARRASMPPAGKRPWSRERGMPSSRASSTSTASRARSTPGTRSARIVPRARIALGGATVQSDSPS